MQTVEYWLNTLESPLKYLALERMTNNDHEANSQSEAVSFGFRWYETKEGYRYWQNIFNQLKEKETILTN